MAGSISDIAVQLSANPAPFVQGLGVAEAATTSWASSTAATLAQPMTVAPPTLSPMPELPPLSATQIESAGLPPLPQPEALHAALIVDAPTLPPIPQPEPIHVPEVVDPPQLPPLPQPDGLQIPAQIDTPGLPPLPKADTLHVPVVTDPAKLPPLPKPETLHVPSVIDPPPKLPPVPAIAGLAIATKVPGATPDVAPVQQAAQAGQQAMAQTEQAAVSWASRLRGKLSAVWNMTATDWVNAMKSGVGKLQALGGMAAKAFTDPLGSLASLLGKIGSVIASIPNVGPILAVPLGVAAAGIGATLALYKVGSDRIKELAAAAGSANVDLASFQTVQVALGADLEDTAKSMRLFQGEMVKAAVEGPNASNAFTRLNLDARALMALSPDQAMQAFAVGLQGVSDKAIQTSVAVDVFGRGAGSVMERLGQGSKWFEKARVDMEKFGLGVGPEALAAVRQAALAGKQIQMLKEGFTTQVTIGVAPILAELSTLAVSGFDALAKSIGGAGFKMTDLAGAVVTGAEVMAIALGFPLMIIERPIILWELAKAAFRGFVAILLEGSSRIVSALALANAGILKSIQLAAKMPGVDLALKGVGIDVQGIMDLGIEADTLGKFAEGMKAEAQGWATAAGKAFGNAMTQMEGTKTFGAIHQFFDKVRERMKATGDAAKAHNPFEIWQKKADDLAKSIQSPFSKFLDAAKDIQVMMAGAPFLKAFQMDPNLGFKGLGAQFQTLMGAVKLPEIKSPAAVLEGSKEAYSAILEFSRGDQQMTVQEKIKAILEESKIVQQEQVRVGQEVFRALQQMQLPGVREI